MVSLRGPATAAIAVAAAGCLVSIPDVTPVECNDPADCAAPRPYCELGAGVCVECLESSACPTETWLGVWDRPAAARLPYDAGVTTSETDDGA